MNRTGSQRRARDGIRNALPVACPVVCDYIENFSSGYLRAFITVPVHLVTCTHKIIYKLSDCRTVGLSNTLFDSLTLFDTSNRSRRSKTVSDSCRTAVGLSDCRTVGHCRTVGNMSETCRKVMSDCRTGAQGEATWCTTIDRLSKCPDTPRPVPLGRVLALTLLNRFSRSYLPLSVSLSRLRNPNSPPGTGYDRKNPAFTSGGGNRTGSFLLTILSKIRARQSR